MNGRPLVLTVLDGWGYSAASAAEGNAIAAARKPNYDNLLRDFPNTLVYTSGPYVGLPEGQMGNSEVGHMNMGAGRILYMDVTRLDNLIATGDFFKHPVLLAAMHHARAGQGAGRRLHLMGLVSDGGVHSMNTHLYALLKMAKREGVAEVCVHCFMDGRDTPPESGAGFVEQLLREMRRIGVGRIATVSGRYYAMDRDKRWERIGRAKDAMTAGVGEKNTDPVAAVKRSYEAGVTDEFIEPVVIQSSQGDARGEPVGSIHPEDACIFFNYRADRGRQMTQALLESPLKLHFTTMTQYDKTLAARFVLDKETPNNILANVMAAEHWKNLRVAETEKYAHVTYFFNGGNEKPYAGEERELCPSPKVATYDLKPEMNAACVSATVVSAIEKRDFDVIVMNFANADMVGHSGKMEPTVRAVEAVDAGLGEIYAALRRKGGRWIVTADHGNAETMIDPVTRGPHTYHTTNPVPLIVVDEQKRPLRAGGSLRDIAPTILGMLQVSQPKEMTGRDLRDMAR
ncbi:MAG TPA: 2,3-bisphosphoglycerate-independent phosphoglycerate mutase [Bryobacteraceae bacterium]|nr:2,3-bisphosphoglycerate-independent phosphoglycerate mutase [Bryobacteraceae bacterium]